MYKTWFHKLKNASNNPKSVNLASKALIAGEGYARETQGISFSADQIDPIDKGIGNDAKLNSNNNNKNSPSNSNTRNKNVATWYNKEFTPVSKKNIKPKKRVYISTNVGNNGKIKTVFNKRGLKTYIRKVRDSFQKAMSPVTRKTISGKNIKPYTSKKKN